MSQVTRHRGIRPRGQSRSNRVRNLKLSLKISRLKPHISNLKLISEISNIFLKLKIHEFTGQNEEQKYNNAE